MTQQDALIYRLADIAGLAQQQFQEQHSHIDPVIGVNRQMRNQGFAVDLLTIDCVVHQNRVTILIEDATPDSVRYQFAKTNQDPLATFEVLPLTALNQKKFLELMIRGLVKNTPQ